MLPKRGCRGLLASKFLPKNHPVCTSQFFSRKLAAEVQFAQHQTVGFAIVYLHSEFQIQGIFSGYSYGQL